jgi:hypothetical protein
MITTNKLPLMKRSRLKAVVNYDVKNKKHGSLLIVNTNSTKNFKNKFGPINIDYNNLFTTVYMKRREQLKIGNRNIIRNRLSDRDSYYNEIEKELPFVNGINEGRLSLGFNLIFELSYANKLFQENTGMLARIKKPATYWDFIMTYLKDLPLNLYPIKTMIINIDDYMSNMVSDLTNRTDTTDPIAYMYFLMKRDLDKFYNIGNIDIIITSSNGSVIRVNPEECKRVLGDNRNNNIAAMFRKELFKLINKQDPEETSVVPGVDEVLRKNRDELTRNISDNLISKFVYGATGDTSVIPEEVKNKIEKEVEKTIDKIANDKGEITEEIVTQELDKNEELLKEIVKSTTNKAMNKPTASSRRDELLREKQLEISIKGKSLEEILAVKSEDIEIPVNKVEEKVETINTNMTDVRFPNINKTYVDELMQKDLVSMFTDMNNKSLKVFVRSITTEDTSDISNYKETYTVELEDELRVRHRLVFDVPKVIDGRFLYLGGNRKYINNQQLLLPIVKVEPDTVQLVSNYNKIFIRRYGDKVASINEKLKKALSEDIKGVRVQRGKYDTENKSYVTTIDYDDLSKLFKELNINGTRVIFDQKEIRNILIKANIKDLEARLDKELLPLGIKSGIYYCIDLTTDEVVMINKEGKTQTTGKTLVDFILSLSTELEGKVGEQNAGKKYMYSRATIMTKQVPIVLLLSYFEGIDGFLKRANIKHYFSDTRPRVSSDEGVIQFEDGFLVYTQKPTAISLLMNGFVDIPTKNYRYEDFNDKYMYQSLFESMFGRRNISNAFNNFLDNFIDPMTMDVLKRLSLPTDLPGMILYGNELLADNQYTHEITVSRIRCAEVINAIVYKNIAKAYEKYKETSTYNNPVKISIKRDAILKEILTQQTVEDYSELNPISEQQKLRCCLRKGPSGCNLAQAYTEVQRSYHPAMTGLFTLSSSPDANVGVNRFLTMEPPITDPRGFIDNKALEGKLDEYNDANLFGIAEALTTGCAVGDDSPRTTMTCRQSGHCVATTKSSPVLVSNGADRVLQYHVSKDWVFTAKDAGVVKELDYNVGLLIVQYDNGECEAVELKRIAKNGAGGFNVSKEMLVNFKKGERFDKNAVLAYDSKFFSENSAFGNRYNIGSFQKVALLSSSLTYEDSSYVSKKLSREMATEVTMQKQAVLGPNTNVDFMVKIGDKIQSGDELIRFERSFNEDSLNALLFNVGEEMKEDIIMSSKDKIKAKFSGVVDDIKVYCTVDIEELSPSLRRIVTDYYDKVNAKRAMLEKYDDKGSVVKCNMLFNEPTGKVETNNGKLRGAVVNDGVLIEFYIKVYDEVGVGDKIVFFSALKSIVGGVIEEGKEAYTLSRPEESIDAVLSCNSLIARGISSAPKMLMSNKLLVELSRKLKEIYER